MTQQYTEQEMYRLYEKTLAEGVVFGMNTSYVTKDFKTLLKEVQEELKNEKINIYNTIRTNS